MEKACRIASIGKVSGQALLSSPFVLGGSLIKSESIWWWLIICHKEEQRDVSKPQTPVGRLHSLGTQAERRIHRLLGCHQGLVCVTSTWVLPRPFGVCDIPRAERSSDCLALHQWAQICTSW